MSKTINTVIGAVLVGIIVLLVLLARPQPIKTVPVQQQIIVEPIGSPTPRAEEPGRGSPTPIAEDEGELPAGVPAEQVYPAQVNFYVNEVLVPQMTSSR